MGGFVAKYICCCFVVDKKKVTKRLKVSRNVSKTSKKYGTDWETMLIRDPHMTASQIEDDLISQNVKIDKSLYKTDKKLFLKNTLQEMGYIFDDHLVGKGGYGEVYRVKNAETGQFCAVKTMQLKTHKEVKANKFENFKNEVFNLKKSEHRNVVKIFNHFMARDLFLTFIVMEFATEGDLNQKLKNSEGKPFSENESKEYFIQMANALNFVHNKGIAHGDFKLENVLIFKQDDGKEVIKVTDFGNSRVIVRVGGVTNLEKAQGTIIYMAPEQLRVYITVNLNKPELLKHPSRNYNPIKADVWSLGVTLYKMLFYINPFAFTKSNQIQSILEMLEEMRKGAKPVQSIADKLNPNCLDLLKNLLEYDKNQRINMKSVLKHLWIVGSPNLDKQ